MQDCFTNKYNLREEDLRTAISYYREYFSDKGAYENNIYPGVTELLLDLKNNGKKLFIATTKAKIFADKILIHFNIRDYFHSIYGSALSTFDFLNKSKSDLISEAIINEKFDESETLMIGDRKFDIIGAKENGIGSVAVTYGYGSAEELESSKPDFIVNSVNELSRLILK